jgi:4'-phosphopantetheinyl transferase
MTPHNNAHPLHAPFLRLWYAAPAALADPAVEQACAELLDEPERARAARFHFARHRHEFLATHALARTALSQAHPLPPRDWSYTLGKYGKPAPAPPCGLAFNQSNSVDLAVCLIGRLGDDGEVGGEIGVDVEPFHRAASILPLVTKVFSPAEREQLAALPVADQPLRALSLWTLKESYIKARGLGLALPLSKISFLFGGDEGLRLKADPVVEPDCARWRFCQLDREGHRISLAVETTGRTPPALEIFPAQPPFTEPVLPVPGNASWFPRSGQRT